MKQYTKPQVIVVEIDTDAALMATSPVTFGPGETDTMEAPIIRRGWDEYEQ